MTDINIGQISEALNDKVDLTSSWGTPTNTYDNLTLPTVNTEKSYIAPADGYFVMKATVNANKFYYLLNKTCGYLGTHQYGPDSNAGIRTWCPATKGQEVVANLEAGSYDYIRFYYARKIN